MSMILKYTYLTVIMMKMKRMTNRKTIGIRFVLSVVLFHALLL